MRPRSIINSIQAVIVAETAIFCFNLLSYLPFLKERSDEIKTFFEAASMEEQALKLDRAMSNILNFTQGMRTSSLSDAVDRHRGMAIKPEHFGMFRDTFLDALTEARITDGDSRDAWRAILDPALAYMRDQINSGPA